MKKVTNGKVHKVDDGSFKEEVLDHKGLVMLDVYADWCGPCRMLAPIMKELAKEHPDKVKVAKFNAQVRDKQKPKTITELKVMALPTIILFKDGEEVERYRGFKEKWLLEKAINDHHA